MQDFGGFRVIVLLPRFKPGWVAPGTYQEELPRREGELGAPKSALPVIMPNGKPICSGHHPRGAGVPGSSILCHSGDATTKGLWPRPAAGTGCFVARVLL